MAQARSESDRPERGTFFVIVTCVAGVILLRVLATLLFSRGLSELRLALLHTVALCALAAVGAASVGFREGLARAPSREYLRALLYGLLSVAVSIAFVKAATALVPEELRSTEADPEAGSSQTLMWLWAATAVPIAEEWLCRGALFAAVRRVADPRVTLLTTSLVFAMLHMGGDGDFLAVPHRFVAGLLFGHLRARSGSIYPGVLAHAVHNFVAGFLD